MEDLQICVVADEQIEVVEFWKAYCLYVPFLWRFCMRICVLRENSMPETFHRFVNCELRQPGSSDERRVYGGRRKRREVVVRN